MTDATTAWLRALSTVLASGTPVAPRGQPTLEVLHRTDYVDLRRPVVVCPPRGLNYRFAAAEAAWILNGQNDLASLTRVNPRMAEFSDDGTTLFGAYGPPIQDQLGHVVNALRRDPDSRQAVLTIWRPNPPVTKDTPCTVAMTFNLRHGKLNQHVFMRSSDLWLGWVYDVFSFSMVAHQVCCRLNVNTDSEVVAVPGDLYLTAVSSHLYEPQWEAARALVGWEGVAAGTAQLRTPPELYRSEEALKERLESLVATSPNHPLRWWEPRAVS